MNNTDTNKIKNKLEQEYNDNCSKIEDLDYKISILKRNQISQKLERICCFSLVPLLFINLIGLFTFKSAAIPFEIVKPLFIGIPLMIGSITEVVLNQKQKTKQKLREFSNAKTEKEKYEEETRYTIEKKKIENRNKVLKKSGLDLDIVEKFNIYSSSENNDINEEKINKNIDDINISLKQKTNNLDIATTKFTLSDSFLTIRNRKLTNGYTFVLSAAYTCILIFVYSIPELINYAMLGIHNVSLQSLLVDLAAMVTFGSVCTGINVKNISDKHYAFKNLNNELKEDAIDEMIIDFDKEDEYRKEVERIINDNSIVKLHLEKAIQKLENLKNNNKNIFEEDYKNYELTKQPIGEIKNYYLDGEFEKRSDEVLSRDLPDEKGPTLQKKYKNNQKKH